MDNIRIVYRILKALEESMDAEEMDDRIISAEPLGVSHPGFFPSCACCSTPD